jgi:glycosyltransferase involved in cell wall biosynthesis
MGMAPRMSGYGPRMRVVVDGRALLAHRGVARYVRELLRHLPAWDVATPRRHRALLPVGTGADVVWAPAPAPLRVARGARLVLTVHDRSWELRPRDFTPYERAWHAVARPRALARRAAAVVVDTEHARRDLAAAWPEVAGRLHVVRPGPGLPASVRPGPLPPGLPPCFALHVGALEPRKGLEALGALRVPLVLAGEGRVRVPGALHLGRVDDAVLAALLEAAACVLVPSHLEGFGLVALEAAERGTPAVVSDIPVHREVLGDGARFAPPGDPAAWAVAVDALLAEARPPLARTGRTWADAAAELRAVVEAAAA